MLRSRAPSALRALRIAAVVGGVGVVAGACVTAAPVDTDVIAALKAAPAGSTLQGSPVGLGEPEVVNRRDFIYAVDFRDDGGALAFTQHVSTHMELTVTDIEPIAPHFQEKINVTEFDAEDVVFDGGRVIVPSRQGSLRAYDAENGKLLTEVATGEALLRVTRLTVGPAGPGRPHLAASTASGGVLLFDDALAIIGHGQLHGDAEVRGLGASTAGEVLSAGTDGTLVVSAVVPVEKAVVRTPATALHSGELVFLSHLDGVRAIATIIDQRQPHTVISRDAVKRLQLPNVDGTTLSVLTAEGTADKPAVDLGEVRVRLMTLGGLYAAVCDDCLPIGAELMLGQDALQRASFTEDVARGELVVQPVLATTAPTAPTAPSVPSSTPETTEPTATGAATEATTTTTTTMTTAQPARLIDGASTLKAVHAISLPGPANDLDVNAAGQALVTFSATIAERSFEVNDAERKGDFPPPSATSGAALVDIAAGALTKRFVGQHLGFTVTGALSPDGRTVVTGGWDRRALVWDVATGQVVTERSFAWLVRRVRVSPQGHLVAVGAWTPVNALNEGDSDPSLVLYPLVLRDPAITPPN